MTARRTRGRTAPGRERIDVGAADPRLYVVNGAEPNRSGAYVLYWCRAYRRASDNLAFDHATRRANEFGVPLLTYEALDVRYPYASDRMHTFVLEGVAEMREAVEARGSAYAFYLPHTREQAKHSHALERLARNAVLVVSDWYPAAGGPRSLWAHTASTAQKLPCRMEQYDDAAIVPMAAFAKHEHAARTIRPKVMSALAGSLGPAEDIEVRKRPPRELEWPFTPTIVTADNIASLVSKCAIDHAVLPVASRRGGSAEAGKRLERFTRRALRNYASERNDMARVVTSGLSPYLHFGHISARAVVNAALASDAAPTDRDAFVEELAVRRTLAFNHVMTDNAHATYAAIPEWARTMLDQHRDDPRPGDHTLAEWEQARTVDPVWNAAQMELVRDGSIHPYARMLWGKVAIALTQSPEKAFEWLLYLNDKYALDGRDPNTYTNIAWCFGLHDHPFPPRAIYGTVRSMTSRSAAAKWDVREYLSRVGAPEDLSALEPKVTRGKHTKLVGGRDELDQP